MTCPVCKKPCSPWQLYLILTPRRVWRVCGECAAWVNDRLLIGRQRAVEVNEDQRVDKILDKARGKG